jgi:hypothetical protein
VNPATAFCGMAQPRDLLSNLPPDRYSSKMVMASTFTFGLGTPPDCSHHGKPSRKQPSGPLRMEILSSAARAEVPQRLKPPPFQSAHQQG